MRRPTHINGGLTSVLVTYILFPQFSIFYFYYIFISQIADLDHPKSKMSNQLKLLKTHTKHRGITHTLLFIVFLIALLNGITYYFYGTVLSGNDNIVLFLLLNSHLLLGDLFTKKGIPYLYPLKARFKIPIVSTNGKSNSELYFSIFLSIINISLIFYIYKTGLYENFIIQGQDYLKNINGKYLITLLLSQFVFFIYIMYDELSDLGKYLKKISGNIFKVIYKSLFLSIVLIILSFGIFYFTGFIYGFFFGLLFLVIYLLKLLKNNILVLADIIVYFINLSFMFLIYGILFL